MAEHITGALMASGIIIALLFSLVYPAIMNSIIRFLLQGRRCIWIPPIIGIIAIVSAIAAINSSTGHPGPASTEMTVIILFIICTFSAAAVVTAYSFLRPSLSAGKDIHHLMIASLVQFPFLIALFVNPESWPGGALPLFADRLPGLGLIFDAFAGILGTAGKSGYEIYFTAGIVTGLYIEVAVGAAIFFVAMAVLTGKMDREGIEE